MKGVCLQAPYAAMEMLHAMRGGTREGKGHFVRTHLDGIALGRIQAATAKHAENKFVMMMANNSKESHWMDLTLARLPLTAESEVYYSVNALKRAMARPAQDWKKARLIGRNLSP